MKQWHILLVAIVAVMATMVISCSKSQMEDTAFQGSTSTVLHTTSSLIPGAYILTVDMASVTDGAGLRSLGFEEKQEYMRQIALRILSENGIPAEKLGYVYGVVLKGFSVQGISQVEQARLSQDRRIRAMEQDQEVQMQGGPPGGGGNGGGGQSTPWGIARVGGSCQSNGRAWILDTGIDLDHPDLNVDASLGYNSFTTGKDSKSLDDGNGHGTHVSGTIAALDNNIGVVGVAPGATVIPVKVLNAQGSGSYSGVISGVNFVGGHGSGDVANMSLGGPVSDALDAAVIDAASSGVKFALAAGNESDNGNNHSPGRANHANIYTVSAMDANDHWASFSNYGNPPVDYCGPGVSILSTWKGGGYNTISGTSMATPHIAGILLCGAIHSDGNVIGDPDGNPDPIAHR